MGEADQIRSGAVSSAELVDAAIARIEALDPELNAISWHRFDDARREAAAVVPGAPFAGVPILLKDHRAEARGQQMRSGTTVLKAHPHNWPTDSHVYRRFVAAGFVVLGRTTTPEFATALVTESRATGITRNPWNRDYSPGGSSGGSAAAVAAGMTAVAHATDGGGSIRVPASACGLVGLKPSRGRISVGPQAAESWAGATVEGALVRTVRDAAALLDVLSGTYPGDLSPAPPLSRPLTQHVGRQPATLRVGCLLARPDGSAANPEVVEVTRRVLDWLDAQGHRVEDTAPSALAEARFTDWYRTIIAVDVEVLARRIEELLGRPLAAGELETRNAELRQRAVTMTAPDYLETRYALNRWAYQLCSWWRTGADDEGFDLLVTPTLADLPPTVASVASAAPAAANFSPHTAFFNVAGLPAISVPVGLSAAGIPVGVQLVAALGREDLLIEVAAALETSPLWHGV